MHNDAELLGRYAHTQDDQAFAELVGRHVNLVFSAALRYMHGDAHLAEDVAQNVFRDLARKAKAVQRNLKAGQSVQGWLYTSTHHAASSLRRSEQRRLSRETNVYFMNETLDLSVAEPQSWSEIRPLLDEAMNKLPRIDRDAVLLRYFAGKDLRAVGAMLRLSEDAARKRIDRSLDRLRFWLAQRGITTTAAALAAELTSHAVQNAPGGLAASLARKALLSTATPAASLGLNFGLKSARLFIGGSVTAVALLLVGLAYRDGIRPTTDLKETGTVEVPETAAAEAQLPLDLAPPPMTFSVPPLSAQVIDGKKALGAGPESADAVGFPKSLLSQIPIRPLTMLEDGTSNLVVEDKFAQLTKMTIEEVTRVNSIIAETAHRYRVEESRHLELMSDDFEDPLAEGETSRSLGLTLIEKVNYRMIPFPKEAQAIQRNFNADIVQALGEERAKLFREKGGSFINGSADGGSAPEGKTDSTVLIFRLTDRTRGPIVDVHRITVSHSGRGLGVYGVDYGAPLDQYAPESLKPVLARWRKWIDEHPPETTPAPFDRTHLGIPAGGILTRQSPAASGKSTEWDEHASKINISQDLIENLKIVGLSEDESVTPEAMHVCNLTRLEADAIRSLYAGMKARFIQIERDHFERIGPGKTKFVLRATTTARADLLQEWRNQLDEMLGSSRGELVERVIRNSLSGPQWRESLLRKQPVSPENFDRYLRGQGVDWLNTETEEITFEMGVEKTGPANQSIPMMFRRSKDGRDEKCDINNPNRIPERWRHLLTPEILGVPGI